MSSVENVVNERRLRPIYECLDYGYNKKAIQEADRLLKKQPNCHCAKALKALALLRQGKASECGDILKNIGDDVPPDDGTLQAMSICYKELNQHEKVCEMYELAVKKDPNNEEFLSHLFMAYVRVGNYKKQQATALSLYKLKPKNPYYFWAVMSIVMQSYGADDVYKKTVCLPLAERMVKKIVGEKKVESDAEMHLFLSILDMSGKHEEALKELDALPKPWSASHVELYGKLRLDLLTKLERWYELNGIFEQLIISNPAQWENYAGYVSTLLKLTEESLDNVERKPTPSSALEFFASVRENHPKERCVVLSRLLLYDQVQKQLGPNSVREFPSIVDLLSDVITVFGHKPCCYGDVRPYLKFLDSESRTQLMGKISSLMGDALPGVNVDLDFVQRRLLYLYLQRHFGLLDGWTIDEMKKYVSDRFSDVSAGMHLCEGLLKTEPRPVDPYVLLAAHALIDIWGRVVQGCTIAAQLNQAESDFLLEAAAILEEFVERSPANHQLKILLTRIYCLVGAIVPAVAAFGLLDVKHVMVDTLSHLTSRLLLPLLHPQNDISFKGILAFYGAQYSDVMECVIATYKFGSFHKVKEFLDFRDKLRDSLVCAVTIREKTILDLFLDPSSHADVRGRLSATLAEYEKFGATRLEDVWDNRDFVTMASWGERDPAVARTDFQLEVAMAQLRDCLIDCVRLMSRCCDESAPRGSTKSHAELLSTAEFLASRRACLQPSESNGLATQNGVDDVAKATAPVESPSVYCPDPARFLAFVSRGAPGSEDTKDLLQCLVLAVRAAASVVSSAAATEESAALDPQTFDELTACLGACVQCVRDWLESDLFSASLVRRRQVFEATTALCEVLGFLVTVAGYMLEMVKPRILTSTKKSKKKKNHPDQRPQHTNGNDDSSLASSSSETSVTSSAVRVLDSFVESLRSQLLKLVAAAQTADDNRTIHRIQSALKIEADDEEDWAAKRRAEVVAKVHRSHDVTLSEVKRLVARKLKHLDSFKS